VILASHLSQRWKLVDPDRSVGDRHGRNGWRLNVYLDMLDAALGDGWWGEAKRSQERHTGLDPSLECVARCHARILPLPLALCGSRCKRRAGALEGAAPGGGVPALEVRAVGAGTGRCQPALPQRCGHRLRLRALGSGEALTPGHWVHLPHPTLWGSGTEQAPSLVPPRAHQGRGPPASRSPVSSLWSRVPPQLRCHCGSRSQTHMPAIVFVCVPMHPGSVQALRYSSEAWRTSASNRVGSACVSIYALGALP
jgi:hypothetical protein